MTSPNEFQDEYDEDPECRHDWITSSHDLVPAESFRPLLWVEPRADGKMTCQVCGEVREDD